ncbi:Mad3/BUB1 homology region 1-domain-containing protein [Phakopsora pachyrhizi]|uniref:Mad3/BUB1 homology region 1-domain-containing protein n=1 Tax=Phakopsora pachyrhizi TaxID=170000 RepID=A0AAV0AJS6_PHAPC|nr:Mad3/BUB1 homology region 1-domain-containing protein [Phakopsora pachyrhizi]
MLSGTKNQEIDITAIENQKENIQPIKSGRSALKLSSLFSSKISQSCSSSSIIDSSKNDNIRIKGDNNDDDYEAKLENLLRVENFNPISLSDRLRKVHLEFQRKIKILELIEKDQSIKNKAGPFITKDAKDQSLIDELRKDPLEVYVQYVRWTIDSYPSGATTAESNLIPLLEQSTRKFLKSKRYKQDLRYLKLWIFYSNQVLRPIAKNIFNFLLVNEIGTNYSLFYEEFGKVCLELKDFRRFREVLKLGIERDERGEAFRLIPSKEKLTKMLESNPASDVDSTRTGEDEVCSGQNSTAEHSKQSTCTRINKGTSSNNRLKSNKFKVFEDGKDDHQIEIPGSMTKWDDLGTVKSNQRQNLIEPTTWKGQRLPMKQSQVQKNQSRPKMKVFDDNIVSLLPCSDIYVTRTDQPI